MANNEESGPFRQGSNQRMNDMSRSCVLTGKTVQCGNRVSHSKRRTRHKFFPNLHSKRFWSQDLKKFVTLKVSSHALRSIDKIGLEAFAKQQGYKLK